MINVLAPAETAHNLYTVKLHMQITNGPKGCWDTPQVKGSIAGGHLWRSSRLITYVTWHTSLLASRSSTVMAFAITVDDGEGATEGI